MPCLSQFLSERSVIDLLISTDRSPELQCHYESHDYIVLNIIFPEIMAGFQPNLHRYVVGTFFSVTLTLFRFKHIYFAFTIIQAYIYMC